MNTTAVVVESQPDWLTAACHHTANAESLRRLAEACAEGEASIGQRRRPFRLMGYAGYAQGRVRYGERGTAGLIQLSGDLADRHLTTVRALQDSLTRLDLAVTCRFAPPTSDLAAELYDDARAFRDIHPRSARPELVQDGDGGSTCYVGDRVSPYLLRVYNKEAEREAAHDEPGAFHYRGCWRFELEVKGAPAPDLARQADEAPDRAAFVQRFVGSYLDAHGLRLPFDPMGGAELVPGFNRHTDRAKTLAWYAKSVAPSLVRLLEQGDQSEVWSALGLAPSQVVRRERTRGS